jgi:hypothetical protein
MGGANAETTLRSLGEVRTARDIGGVGAAAGDSGHPCEPAGAVGGDRHRATEEQRASDRAASSSSRASGGAPAGGGRWAIADVAVLAIEGTERLFWRRYPREVALSFFDGRILCWLVRPEHEWPWTGGGADATSRPGELGRGANPATVAAELACAAEGRVVCAEAPAVATWWLTALFAVTGRPVPFEVKSLDEAVSWTGLPPDTVEAVRTTVDDVYSTEPRSACGAVTAVETLRALTHHVAARRIREGCGEAASAGRTASTAAKRP